MAMTIVALLGCMVATYLTLHAYGIVGELSCTLGGSCEIVQASRWSRFLAFPVALWGLGYYVTVFALSILSLQERFAASRAMANVLLALTAWGFLFSGWLTSLEKFTIHAWCQWWLMWG